MMDKPPSEEKNLPIELTLQGAKYCISISKGTMRALGPPSHVSLKVNEAIDSISVFPCDDDDPMAFRVPDKLLSDRSCVMRINSKQFVHSIMRANNLDITRTYSLAGRYLKEENTAVFSLVDGVTLRKGK